MTQKNLILLLTSNSSFDANLSQHIVTFIFSDEEEEAPPGKENYQNEDPMLPQQLITGELPEISSVRNRGDVFSLLSLHSFFLLDLNHWIF
jgi:hypothetical protein